MATNTSDISASFYGLFLYFSSRQLISHLVFPRKVLNSLVHSLHFTFNCVGARSASRLSEKSYISIFLQQHFIQIRVKNLSVFDIFSAPELFPNISALPLRVMQNRCYKISITFCKIGKLQIAADYTEKKILAQRFLKFENYHSSTLPVFCLLRGGSQCSEQTGRKLLFRGVDKIFQRGGHTVSKRGYSPDCHVDLHALFNVTCFG